MLPLGSWCPIIHSYIQQLQNFFSFHVSRAKLLSALSFLKPYLRSLKLDIIVLLCVMYILQM